jgi:hypothetical protein
MARLICALVLVLLISTPSFGQQSLVGTYKLVSQVIEVDGKPTEHMGQAQVGYLVFTPTRFIHFVTAVNRKPGSSVEEKAALFDTLAAYAGTYRVEGDKFITTAEIMWTGRTGAPSVETFKLEGTRLTNSVGPAPFPRDPTKKMIRRQVWEKIE